MRFGDCVAVWPTRRCAWWMYSIMAAFTRNREECIAHVRGPQRIQSDKFIDQRPPQHRR